MNLAGSIRINKCGMLIITALLLIFCYYVLLVNNDSSSRNNASQNLNEINLRLLLIAAVQAAEHGGLEVLAISNRTDFHVKSKGRTKEGKNDPVSEADFRSHCVMRKGLKHIFPRLRIVSEEDVDQEEEKRCHDVKLYGLDTVLHESNSIPDEIVPVDEVTVWVDPLDATQEFTERLFHYVTTMTCVAVNGKPRIGVIHNPFTKKTTWAWVGQGMSEDLLSVKRNQNGDITSPIFVVSRSHAGNVETVAKSVFGEKAQVIPAAGAGYKVLQVVFGNATAYIHTTAIKKWDLCAGNAILNALDGRMTNLDNEEINYDADSPVVADKGLIATLNNHDQLVAKISESKFNWRLK